VLWNDPGASTTDPVSGLCEGQYTATITDAQGCVGTSQIVSIATGITEWESSSTAIAISPNPGFGMFRVALSNANTAEIIWSVTDSRGRIVKQAPSVQLAAPNAQFVVDLTDMAQGLYHLQIGFNGSYSSHRLMVLANH
jgi:hypothetical protein